jgi:hypothetical protein
VSLVSNRPDVGLLHGDGEPYPWDDDDATGAVLPPVAAEETPEFEYRVDDDDTLLYVRRRGFVKPGFGTLGYIAPTTVVYAIQIWHVLWFIAPTTILISPRLQVGTLVNTSAPSITGDPVEGQVLRAWPGVWTGIPPLTYTYQWERETGVGTGIYVDIAGATGSSYICVAADVGLNIRVTVQAY